MISSSPNKWPLRAEGKSVMHFSSAPIRHRAVSMQLAAHLDGQYVEMHILTDTGKVIEIICEKNSIFSVQQHIDQIGRDCPEISNRKSTQDAGQPAQK